VFSLAYTAPFKPGSPARSILRVTATVVAFAGLFLALSLPNRLLWVTPAAFIYFPLELVFIGLLLLLPGRCGTVIRAVLAALLGVALLLRTADLMSHEVLGRPFDLIFDSHLLADGGNVLSGALGDFAAVAVGAGLLLLATLLCWLAFAMLNQIQQALVSQRTLSAASLTLLLAAWVTLDLSGWSRTGHFTYDQLVWHGLDTLNSVRDIRQFAETVDDDVWAANTDDSLLSGLQGKDVFIVFAESYGRVLLEQEPFADSVTANLARAQRLLDDEGVSVRSAFLTSPTVGGLSWLAHASTLSGAWIDSETRFETLVMSKRITLNRLFQKAGWRTVAAMPGITMAWPEGDYFGYDHVYNAHNFGYEGEPFNWVTMPDQYVLSALQERERSATGRAPVMAEVALISSHAPWTPIAKLVPWEQVGNGEVFNAQALSGPTPEAVWKEVDSIRSHYRQAIEYMLDTLVSYVQEYGDESLVILLLGDHPPAPMVSGDPDTRQVPVHLIARDPEIMKAVDSWQWQPGLLPGADAPVWRMDVLRDRFVEAFSGVSVLLAESVVSDQAF
jgi:hypothetical protein